MFDYPRACNRHIHTNTYKLLLSQAHGSWQVNELNAQIMLCMCVCVFGNEWLQVSQVGVNRHIVLYVRVCE